MISKEQAHAAAAQLRTKSSNARRHDSADVSPEIFAEALAVACNTPDTRFQRMAEAQHLLATEAADSRAVASMMIQRILSDSLR